MERNYDELISETLIQIDKHTEELAAIRMEQSVLNQKMLKSLDNQFIFSQAMLKSLDELSNKLGEQSNVSNQLSSQIAHSANILDRIIKKNDLRI